MITQPPNLGNSGPGVKDSVKIPSVVATTLDVVPVFVVIALVIVGIVAVEGVNAFIPPLLLQAVVVHEVAVVPHAG